MAKKKINPTQVDYNKALEWLNKTLRHMKSELKRIDGFFNKTKINPEKIRISQEKVSKMHEVCDDFEKSVDKYSKSKEWTDLNTAFTIAEMFEPSFELNYNEIVMNAEQAGFEFPEEA